MEDTAINLVLSAFVGIISALAATFFAFRKFRAEKVWELRAEAYRNLIDALHEMKRVRDAELDAQYRGSEIASHVREQLWQESRNAKRRILQIFDNAAFLISEEVSGISREFTVALDRALRTDSLLEMLEAEGVAISSCLEKVKKVGRKELRI